MEVAECPDCLDPIEDEPDRLDPLTVPRFQIDALTEELNRLPLVGAFLEHIAALEIVQQPEQLLRGAILQIHEHAIRGPVAGDGHAVEPATVREPVEILAGIGGEVHICRIDPVNPAGRGHLTAQHRERGGERVGIWQREYRRHARHRPNECASTCSHDTFLQMPPPAHHDPKVLGGTSRPVSWGSRLQRRPECVLRSPYSMWANSLMAE